MEHRQEVPEGANVTYYNPQVKVKTRNGELLYRVRGTAGGDRIHYDGDTAALTASLPTVTLFLNAAVSEDAQLMSADISDFYLVGTRLDTSEYMDIKRNRIPLKI